MSRANSKGDIIRVKAVGTISGLEAFAKLNAPYIINSSRLYPHATKNGVYRCYTTLKITPRNREKPCNSKQNP